MKLDICHKKEENVLFSIYLNQNNSKESKTIVFAPNGVGKTSIANALQGLNNSNHLLNGFFVNNNIKDEKIDCTIEIFRGENYENYNININKVGDEFLTKTLRKQFKREWKWLMYSFILGKFSYDFGYPDFSKCEDLRLIPYGIESCRSNPSWFEDSYLSIINRERVQLLLSIINLHLRLISLFFWHGKSIKTSKNSLSTNEINCIKEAQEKMRAFHWFLTYYWQGLKKLIDDHYTNSKDLLKLHLSWEFMRKIYNLDLNQNKEFDKQIFSLNLEKYKEVLKWHKKKIKPLIKNIKPLQNSFKYTKWISINDFLKNFKTVQNRITTHLNINKGVDYCLYLQASRIPSILSVVLFPNTILSEGQLKANMLLMGLDLMYSDKMNIDLLIFDDPVTSLDYFHTSVIVTYIEKETKKPLLVLTHNFNFFSKFFSLEENPDIKKICIDRFNNREVFSIKVKTKDISFILGKLTDSWEFNTLNLDEFIFSFNLVYELIKSFSIKNETTEIIVSNIHKFIRDREVETQETYIKTIKEFVNRTEKELDHYCEISFVKKFLDNYYKYIFSEKSSETKNILEIDLDDYILNWDKNQLDIYKERIRNKELGFCNYLIMKYLLIQCCYAKYKALKNQNLHKGIKKIYDQIKSLKHFESLRFIPLLEISCETILEYISYLNQNK